ncbi:LysR family transcriptional regulator [Bifidobacterium asteroides]|uniref:LysR family transcriptional regulator n=1 Tax=Bifidobacterium asteroides TaxID=1684 RepID=UPI0018DB20BC
MLKYFLAIVEEGSITGAAEYLSISQPSLSRQIKDLEEHLGHKLFDRGSRTITLTPAGELLRDRAREIVLMADRAEAELTSMNKPINGNVYIGAGETEAVRFLARAAGCMLQQYPQVKFHIFSGNGQAITDQLESGLLDFGLLFEPSDNTKYSYISLPTADRWGLLMRKDSTLASRDGIRQEDIEQIPLLLSRQVRFDSEFSGWSSFSEHELHVVGTYNLLFNASLFVSEGCGYALCLDRIINLTDNSNLVFKPLMPELRKRVNLVWKSDRHFSSAASHYLEILRRQIGTENACQSTGARKTL